ncbi:MAG: LCP family protein [Actinobacteria bacterium]|nr:LCP family protein [Actinomycetota bacterium]
MGRHSAPKNNSKAPQRRRARTGEIDRLEPASTSSETPSQQTRRKERPDFGERNRRTRRRKRVAMGCLSLVLIFLALAAVAGVFYVRSINSKMQDTFKTDKKADAALDKPVAEKRGEPFYVLLMGVDSREIGEAARSDTLIIARIDPKQQRVTLVSIPRDTRVSIPGHGKTKINAAHAYGGPALVIETVKDITGLPISHYAEVDFKGFKDVVDALGGVTVTVPEDIYDMKAANHVTSAAKLSAGTQVLDGAHALTFVRSRQFPRGDLQRIENQQTFLKAVLKESLKPGNVLRLPSVVSAIADSATTDLSVGDLLSIANQMKGMDSDALEAVTMPGAPQMIGGGSYVVMDEEGFASMIERVKTGQPAEATDTSDTATAEPYQIEVTVKNGSGISGVASDAGRRLRNLDFRIGEIGNMNQMVYDETLIVYKKNKDRATLVSEALGKGKVVTSRGMYSFDTDVLVVVGKDWGPPVTSHDNQIPID